METHQLPSARTIAALVKDLASFYVTKPDHLMVEVQESSDGRAAYFALRGDPTDDSRLVGREGSHVRSLTLLINEAGVAQERTFTFRLHTQPGTSAPWDRPHDAMGYNPKPIQDVLARWLAALGVDGCEIRSSAGEGPRRNLSFDFNIALADETKARELLGSGNQDQLAVIPALGTLLRAAGRQQGVRLQLNLVDKR